MKNIVQHYDAIVVGTGISGGWAAKELCEKGLKTLVLERGRDVKHVVDYEDMKSPWELPHRGRTTMEDRRISPVQIDAAGYHEGSRHFFLKDMEHPYEQKKPFQWARGYQVGGRSLIWGRQCYRRSNVDFEANAKDGFGVDWPIRYEDIAPWYDYVEPFIGIAGSLEGLPHLPDGKFQPPMPMNCVEKTVADRVKKAFQGERLIIHGRTANHTHRIGTRGPCQYRGKCETGCTYAGYFSSNSATLPAAADTSNLTLRPHSVVSEVVYDKERRKAIGVKVIDAQTLEAYEYFAKVIFLNASTLNTTLILLNSVSDAFPNGLGNGSGQIGHNLMDMPYGMGASGIYDGYRDKYTFGNRPTGIFVPRFRNISEKTKTDRFLRGYTYQGGAGRGRTGWADGVGLKLKKDLSEAGDWHMSITAWGEHLPYYDNKVELSKTKKDRFGMPILEIECDFRENEFKLIEDAMSSAAEILEAGGLKNVKTHNWNKIPGACIHETGTARMGKDPKTSVLNKWNQMHEVRNVFITDGSAMSSSSCIPGPSVTYMALTARAVDYAVKEMRKGNIR